MPWPNDVLTRTVFGTYLAGSGEPAKGRVTFTPTTRVVDEDDAVIVESTLTAPLDINGSFEIDLPVTDNALLRPDGWAYKVSIRLYGVKPQSFYALLPYGDGSDVDIRSEISSGTEGTTASNPVVVQGPAGPRGPGVLIDSGLPSNLVGVDGDIYIDSDTGSYYGPKANGVWSLTAVYSLDGALTQNQRHVHTQASVSSSWTITHALGGRPSVTVVDSAGTVIIGEVKYNSDTEVVVSFTSPFSGFAYLT